MYSVYTIMLLPGTILNKTFKVFIYKEVMTKNKLKLSKSRVLSDAIFDCYCSVGETLGRLNSSPGTLCACAENLTTVTNESTYELFIFIIEL